MNAPPLPTASAAQALARNTPEAPEQYGNDLCGSDGYLPWPWVSDEYVPKPCESNEHAL